MRLPNCCRMIAKVVWSDGHWMGTTVGAIVGGCVLGAIVAFLAPFDASVVLLAIAIGALIGGYVGGLVSAILSMGWLIYVETIRRRNIWPLFGGIALAGYLMFRLVPKGQFDRLELLLAALFGLIFGGSLASLAQQLVRFIWRSVGPPETRSITKESTLRGYECAESESQ